LKITLPGVAATQVPEIPIFAGTFPSLIPRGGYYVNSISEVDFLLGGSGNDTNRTGEDGDAEWSRIAGMHSNRVAVFRQASIRVRSYDRISFSHMKACEKRVGMHNLY